MNSFSRIFLLLGAWLALATPPRGAADAIVTNTLSDWGFPVVTNRRVVVQNLSAPNSQSGGGIALGARQTYTTTSGGVFVMTNVAAGVYKARVLWPPDEQEYSFIVYPTNTTLNAGDQMVAAAGNTLPGDTVSWGATASDRRYLLRGEYSNGVPTLNGRATNTTLVAPTFSGTINGNQAAITNLASLRVQGGAGASYSSSGLGGEQGEGLFFYKNPALTNSYKSWWRLSVDDTSFGGGSPWIGTSVSSPGIFSLHNPLTGVLFNYSPDGLFSTYKLVASNAAISSLTIGGQTYTNLTVGAQTNDISKQYGSQNLTNFSALGTNAVVGTNQFAQTNTAVLAQLATKQPATLNLSNYALLATNTFPSAAATTAALETKRGFADEVFTNLVSTSVLARSLRYDNPALTNTFDNLDAGVTSDLLAYWSMDEASGDRVDVINSFNLTDNSVLATAGVRTNAALFEGAEYLSSSASELALDYATHEDWTIAGWAHQTSSGGGQHLFSHWTGSTNDSTLVCYVAGGQLYVYAVGLTGVATNWAARAFPADTNVFWSLRVNSFEMVVSVNGAMSALTWTNGLSASSEPLVIGNGFVGWIDEVGFWSRNLGDSELETIYNGGYGAGYVEYAGTQPEVRDLITGVDDHVTASSNHFEALFNAVSAPTNTAYLNIGDNLSHANEQEQFVLALSKTSSSAAISWYSGLASSNQRRSADFQTYYGRFTDWVADNLSQGTHNMRWRFLTGGGFGQFMLGLQTPGASTAYNSYQLFATGMAGVNSAGNPTSAADYDGNTGAYWKASTNGNFFIGGGVFTNYAAVWLVTNNVPTTAFPNGSIASRTDTGQIYFRTNSTWTLIK